MSGGSGVPLSDRINVERNKLDESIRDYCLPSTSEASILPQSLMVTTNVAGLTAVHEMRGDHAETNGGDIEPDLAYFPCIEKDCKYIAPNAAALYKHCKRMNHARLDGPCHEECPLCSLRLRDVKALILHAEQQHQFRGGVETVDFTSFAAFKVWKEDIEKETVIFYSIRSTKKWNEIEYLSYKCHRFHFQARTDFLNKKIHVEYCSTHIGHGLQPQFLPLSSRDAEEIVRLLRCRFSVPRTTRVLREAHQDKTERMYWCTAQDVRSVAQALDVQPGKRHENDLESIALRVQEKHNNDGIQFFQTPDENSSDFCLIIITPTQLDWLKTHGSEGISADDTHKTCRYNLKLLTIMTVDELRRGLPVAFMLSSKMDSATVSRIFEVVKNLWPTFCPRSLMTDVAEHFGKLILKVSFQKEDDVKQKELRAALRALFVEANKPLWKRLLCYFLTLLEKLKGHEIIELRHASEDFENYFRQNYLSRKEEWAPYARRNSSMNTTMFNERFHRLLKYSYLNKTTNSRVDFLIQCLIDLVEDLKRCSKFD
ncbi:unnamed protein product [Cylicocyclus nassatus]|uniref:C2H2-type domain-containing protein n=1 Tax=Cylicocyclus nassatus TaxID=53992 RepID=A0AA36H3H1_CYLNA|nr:unnamed protein product [Cylicocyclus nassatus]